jgi:hypothetical protein
MQPPPLFPPFFLSFFLYMRARRGFETRFPSIMLWRSPMLAAASQGGQMIDNLVHVSLLKLFP